MKVSSITEGVKVIHIPDKILLIEGGLIGQVFKRRFFFSKYALKLDSTLDLTLELVRFVSE